MKQGRRPRFAPTLIGKSRFCPFQLQECVPRHFIPRYLAHSSTSHCDPPTPKNITQLFTAKYTLVFSHGHRSRRSVPPISILEAAAGYRDSRSCVVWGPLFCHSVPAAVTVRVAWLAQPRTYCADDVCTLLHLWIHARLEPLSRRKIALLVDRLSCVCVMVRILSWERIWDVVPPYRNLYSVIPRLFSLVPDLGSLFAGSSRVCSVSLTHSIRQLSVPTAAAFSKRAQPPDCLDMAGVLSCCTPTVKKSFKHIFILVIHRHSVFWQLNNRVICSFVSAGPNTLGVFEGDTR
jgi:hypothetical protein